MKKEQSGFSLVEFLIVIAIMAIIGLILMNSFSLFNKNQALQKDTEVVLESLAQARSLTLASQNASQYGVHFGTTKATVFTGTTYSAATTTNIDMILSSTDTILTISLAGGGSDVIFKRLTGETANNGTIVISSPTSSSTRTVTIYKTGIFESN